MTIIFLTLLLGVCFVRWVQHIKIVRPWIIILRLQSQIYHMCLCTEADSSDDNGHPATKLSLARNYIWNLPWQCLLPILRHPACEGIPMSRKKLPNAAGSFSAWSNSHDSQTQSIDMAEKHNKNWEIHSRIMRSHNLLCSQPCHWLVFWEPQACVDIMQKSSRTWGSFFCS